MATPAQINANRLNALKSTGPRSAEGKAVSRFNALKHGMDAHSLVVPGEDPEALETLTAEYHAQLQPEGPTERHQVDTMVHSDWLRRRLLRAQAELYNVLTADADPATPLGAAWERDSAGSNALQKIFRQISTLDRNYARALAELRRLQDCRRQTSAIELDNDLPLAIMAASGLATQPGAGVHSPRLFGFVPAAQSSAHQHASTSEPPVTPPVESSARTEPRR